MMGRKVAISLLLVVIAVVAQTAVFGDGRINPFGASPAVVIVVVLACSRYLDAEPSLLLGFTAGMLVDLLGGSPLGLWAMAYTVAVYVGLRFRERAEDGPVMIGIGVFALTLLANALFLIIGTLFGERFFTSTIVIKNTLMPAVYNLAIAAIAFPIATRLIGDRHHLGWSS
ncbi:MAG: rod shape-determining protein MreD [Acidimicrobiia bacterium]|nr:rod shape-determining protein MreD [Acidimicrobiia bacterium]MDX2466558.1 rod shape-determining protein MreD [Acidimicrobiia bacterium]